MIKITGLELTEERRREILNVTESMMMDYINKKSDEGFFDTAKDVPQGEVTLRKLQDFKTEYAS
ncbi:MULTISPECIES: hypothetical protein [Priestia]|uniref:hypothetical protein n=1 Tax=Priestia TaxID=2800373 RepID=UPI000E3186D4|nr:hypothetical protein [Priestia megaterium]MBU8852917.1 hypothetical protein [Bacillus sp. FJAT-26377]